MSIQETIAQLTKTEAELERQLQAVRTARKALEGTGKSAPAPTHRRASRARTTAPRQNASRRTVSKAEALAPDKVISLVTFDGVAASDIREQTGGTPDQLLKVLKSLEEQGAVRRSGQRRATRWHLANQGTN